MRNRGITSPLSIIELDTKLSEVKGTFTYLNYDKNERVSTEDVLMKTVTNDAGDESKVPVIPGDDGADYPARWVTIKIKPEDNYTSLPDATQFPEDFAVKTSSVDTLSFLS